MPNITLLPTITSLTDQTTFVIVDTRLTRRINYASIKTQLATELPANSTFRTNIAAYLASAAFTGPTGPTGPAGGVASTGGGYVDNSMVRYDGVSGTLIQTSLVSISDTGAITAPIASSVIPFHYASTATFPSASTYHGAIAHSHYDGKMYFAHGGVWRGMANDSDVPAAYSVTSIDSFIDVDTVTTPPLNGQALLWNSAESVWAPGTVGSGIGLSSRSSVVGTSTSLLANDTGNLQIAGYKSYLLSKVTTTYPAWVRIYTDGASRTADAARLEGNDPLPGSGIIAEVITTAGNLTQLITPGVMGFNNDISTVSTIYLSVTNKDSVTRVINVTLNLLQLEN